MEDLPRAAAAIGSPDAITHAEISAFLVEQTLVAGTLVTVKSFVRGQQIGLLIFLAIIVLGTVACFQAARWLSTRVYSHPADPSQPEI